jgi:single-strand DNA-binding protein
MAVSLNKVVLIGNLGKDPEVRITQDGTKVAVLSVATSEQWKDRATEERKERVEWHRVVVFNARLAEIAERYLKKGQRVYVEGQIQGRRWTDEHNQEHNVKEIVIRFKGDIMVLDSRSNGDQRPGMDLSSSGSGGMGAPADIDDEIPF